MQRRGQRPADGTNAAEPLAWAGFAIRGRLTLLIAVRTRRSRSSQTANYPYPAAKGGKLFAGWQLGAGLRRIKDTAGPASRCPASDPACYFPGASTRCFFR